MRAAIAAAGLVVAAALVTVGPGPAMESAECAAMGSSMHASDASIEFCIESGTTNCVTLPPDDKLNAAKLVEVGLSIDSVQGSVEHITPPRTAAFDRPERSTMDSSLMDLHVIFDTPSVATVQLGLLVLLSTVMGLKQLTRARCAAQRGCAATLIQAAYRGFAARSDFNEFLEVSATWVRAARCVQRTWRSHQGQVSPCSGAHPVVGEAAPSL